MGPRAGLDGRKISPHRDSIPGVVLVVVVIAVVVLVVIVAVLVVIGLFSLRFRTTIILVMIET